MEAKEDKTKSSTAAKKSKDRKSAKKWTPKDFYSSAVESSEESFAEHKPFKKDFILHGWYSHTMDNWKILHAIASKHRQKKKL